MHIENNFLYDLFINILANFIFIFLALFLFLITNFFSYNKAKKFFGITNQSEKVIVISHHEDNRTATKNVVVLEEIIALEYFRHHITSLFNDSALGKISIFLAGLAGIDIRIPEIEISTASPDNIDFDKYLLIIGGPARNPFTKKILSKCDPWISFSSDTQVFIIAKGNRRDQEIEYSKELSIIEKVELDQKRTLLAYGFGEAHTNIAVKYLTNNWKMLLKKYDENEFAICFVQESSGNFKIIEEFTK